MKNLIIAFSFALLSSGAIAQNVGIGTNAPNASAKLDITSTNSGLLVPRVSLASTADVTTIPAPATSLLVYNTNAGMTSGSGVGYYYWTGMNWTKLLSGTLPSSGWDLTGNAGTNASTNFIGTTNAVDFVTRTNNTERMRMTSGGNLGIGTATPGYRLDLANGTFAYGTNNSRTQTRTDAGLQGNVGAQSGHFETSAPVNYPTGASSWWHLIDARHSNPANNYAMQIAGSFFNQEIWFRKTNNNGATAWTQFLTTRNGWSTVGNSGTNPNTNFIGTTDNDDFVMRTNNVERVRVKNAGNVGIGTNNPTQLLTIAGTARVSDVFAAGGQNFVIGDDSYLSDMDVAHRLGIISRTNTAIGEIILGNTATNPVLTGTAGNLYINQEVRIQAANNRVRRSLRPQTFTDAFDNFPNGVHLSNNESEEGGFWANGNYAMVYSPGDNDLVKFVDEDGWNNAGTAYDGTALRARIDGGGNYYQVSDANAKNNILKIDNGLSKVMLLNGYTYNFNLLPGEIEKNSPMLKGAGVLAQEVENVLPEAVSNVDGHYMVNYQAFVPLFIEAIKDQQALIDLQNKTILDYERELEATRVKQEELAKEMAEIKRLLTEKK